VYVKVEQPLHNRSLYKHETFLLTPAQHAHASTSPRTEDSDEARAKDREGDEHIAGARDEAARHAMTFFSFSFIRYLLVFNRFNDLNMSNGQGPHSPRQTTIEMAPSAREARESRLDNLKSMNGYNKTT
jgi:hypothetical protein